MLAADLRAFVAAVRKELRTVRRYPAVDGPDLGRPAAGVVRAHGPSILRLRSAFDRRVRGAIWHRRGRGLRVRGFAMYMWLSTILWGPGTALAEQMRGSLEAVFLTPTSRLVANVSAARGGVAHAAHHIHRDGRGRCGASLAWRFLWAACSDRSSSWHLSWPSLYAIGALFAPGAALRRDRKTDRPTHPWCSRAHVRNHISRLDAARLGAGRAAVLPPTTSFRTSGLSSSRLRTG